MRRFPDVGRQSWLPLYFLRFASDSFSAIVFVPRKWDQLNLQQTPQNNALSLMEVEISNEWNVLLEPDEDDDLKPSFKNC